MQNFTDIPSTRTLSDSLAEILNNDKTAISCSSGTTFPTTNLQLGMLCFRTDQNKLYILKGTSPSAVWVEIMDVTASSGKAPNAEAVDGINGSAVLLKASNLSDLENAATARSNLGIGNVENKSSATIRSEITSENVTGALGMSASRATFLASANDFTFRNRIINGDMRIDQRNNGASVSPAASQYTLDRWNAVMNAASAKYSVQQNAGSVTPPAGFSNYLGATSLGAYTVAAGEIMAFQQAIEGYNIADLGWGTASAASVTLSFWVRSSLTGTFGGAVRQGSGARSYPFTYTISSANTWEYKTVTIPGDTTGTYASNNTAGLLISFGLGVGSTFSGTAGSWADSNFVSATGATSVVGTNGATFYITGVQLEAGTVATPFERRPYGTELALCQRYYQLTGAYFAATQPGNELNCVGSCNVKVDMRANPTATLPAGSRFHRPGVAFYAASAVDVGPSATGTDYQTVTIAAGAGAGTVGQIDRGLILSAEL